MSEVTTCIISALPGALKKALGLDEESIKMLIESGKIKVAPTPDPSLGDYGIAIHVLLKNVERAMWDEIGRVISREFYLLTHDKCWVEKVEFINGYINVTIDYTNMLSQLAEKFYNREVFNELSSIGKGTKVIVEHTSANPVHPLHIGSGRNSIIGDTYARLLKKLGFQVTTRFYVNDLGRQVAILVYGAKIVESKGVKKPDLVKVDHWYGIIYALTNVLIELSKIREEIRDHLEKTIHKATNICEQFLSGNSSVPRDFGFTLCDIAWKRSFKPETIKQIRSLLNKLVDQKVEVEKSPLLKEIRSEIEDVVKLLKEYEEYLKSERRLATYFPEVYSALRSEIRDYREAEEFIEKLMLLAEREDPETLSLFKKIAENVLEGFKETLNNMGIVFNGYDYESSKEILGKAQAIVEELIRTGYTKMLEGGAIEVDLNLAARDHRYVRDLFHPDQAGRFVIRRKDSTTLYITRDIAYTIYKFRELGAERVYNIIAVEQSREQKQLKAVLYILGFRKEAENLYHFAYEMVHLKGMKMSGRRGVYYTIDEMLVDSKLNILQKLVEKHSEQKIAELLEIAEKLATANVRAILLSVDPSKVLVFDPKKIGGVEYGIMIEYAFVRAQGVIRNLWNMEFIDNPVGVFSKIGELSKNIEKVDLAPEEKKILEHLLNFKKVLKEAYEEMKPNKVLEYAINLAVDFNKFYEKYPVIGERDQVKKNARILVTLLVLIALFELMDILGMPMLRRM